MFRQLFDDDTDTRKIDVLALLERAPTQLLSIEDAILFARAVRANGTLRGDTRASGRTGGFVTTMI